MSINIDSLLEKIINENFDINYRAMENIITKISFGLLDLSTISEKQCYNFLFCFIKWFLMYLNFNSQVHYDFTLVKNALLTFNNSLEIFPIFVLQKINSQFNINSIFYKISECNSEFVNICELIQQKFSKILLNNINNKNENYLNTSPNQTINTNVNFNNSNYNTNNNTINNFTNTYQFQQQQPNDLIYANSNSNQNIQNLNNNNNNISFNYSTTQPNNNNIQTTNNNTSSNIFQTSTKKLTDNNNNNNNNVEENLCSFPKIVIPQNEEQIIFDVSINLKFGDSLQIYQSFNILYNQILNDIPIEYLLNCDELLRGIFQILENCNFLEFGIYSFKIINKLFELIEKKLNIYLNTSLALFSKESDKNLFIDTNNLSKIENFFYFSLISILTSMKNDVLKISFYLPLLKKNYIILNKLIMNYPNYYEIYYNILLNFHNVVIHYRTKNIFIENFLLFNLNIYINMNDEMFLDLLENDYEIEIIIFISEIFFEIINFKHIPIINKICSNLLKKFETLQNENKQIENFLIDYNNATLISKSLQITKNMLNGESENKTIIDNFYNILLSLKYLNNNVDENEFNAIFPNNNSPLIKAICDFYIQNPNENLSKSIDLLGKLLSFKSSEKIDSTMSIYKSIYDELLVKGEKIFNLFLNSPILNIFYRDLMNENYEDVILEILFILFNNDDIINNNNIKQFFLILPPFLKNLKFSSLQTKFEGNLNYEEIFNKYLKYLFSKNDNIRFNAINFFNNNINNFDNNNKEYLELTNNDKNLKENFTEFKKFDTLILIQTATNEFLKILKNINNESTNIISNTNEFIPLLNIFLSNKMDFNMKTSALNQMIFMIKNPNYKNYFLNEIFDNIIKEINSSNYETNNKNNSYFTSLIKLLNCLIFFYLNEEKIQIFLNSEKNKTTLNKMLEIALQKDSSKHIQSSFALLFIFMNVFYYKNTKSIFINDSQINDSFPIIKFYDKFYYINLLPIKFEEEFYLDEHSFDLKNSILNFSINKNVLDFMHYLNEPLLYSFDFNKLCENIKNLKNLNVLDVYVSITQIFSFYTLYQNENIDISNSLILIMFHIKKFLPINQEIKNLILDFLNLFSLFLYANKDINVIEIYNKIFFPFLPEFILSQINFISINKDFINNLGSDIDNENFTFDLINFINENKQFFPFNDSNSKILQKFFETYNNLFIFNQEFNFYNIKMSLIKFECIFLNKILSLNLPEKIFSDTLNTISFFLTKYETNFTYKNFNYIKWILNLIFNLLQQKKCKDLIENKSYIFVKLLQSPFIEINIFAINILNLLLSQELFEKHGTILNDLYFSAKNSKEKIIKINYLNFIVKSFDFILSKKSLDENKEENEFVNEIFAMNEKIFEEGELIQTLSSILNNKNYDSMETNIFLKYLFNCLNIDIENIDYIKGIFFNFNFYDFINDLINKEIKNLNKILSIDSKSNPFLILTPNNAIIQFNNEQFKNNLCLTSALESILNVKECINLIIRSFPLLNEEIYFKFKSILNEIFQTLINFNQLVSNVWNKWNLHNFKSHIKVLQSFVLKYFSFLHYFFVLNFEKKEVFINNLNKIIDTQKLNNVCYDFMKFDNEKSDYNNNVKIMFSKILPFLIEIVGDNNKINNSKINIKNDGDTLLEIMIIFKKIYDIKVDPYDSRMKSIFTIDNNNLKNKNDIMNSVISILLNNQNCKRIFIKSKFINTFVDYINQLKEFLLNESLNSSLNNSALNNNNKNNKTLKANLNNSSSVRENKKEIFNYVLDEFINVLKVFQNLTYNFNKCSERDELFLIDNNNNNNNNKEISLFLNMLFNIFFDTIRFNNLFENYLKLLMNIISNDNGELTKYFLINLNNKKKNNENLLNLILDYFNQNLNTLINNQNFDTFINLLKCLFQYRPISFNLLRTKFDENLQFNIKKLIINKKTFKSEKNIYLLGKLLNLIVSLSFDPEHSKKLGNKEFVLLCSEPLLKTKNEEILFNTIFFYRNLCFVQHCKYLFMSNPDLLGIIFSLFTSDKINIKIRFILSNLIWILLYNNQNLKTMLSKEEFKVELKLLNIHLQKELDMKKINLYNNNNNNNDIINNEEEKKNNETQVISNDSNLIKSKDDEYLENTCLNMRKIMHILEI